MFNFYIDTADTKYISETLSRFSKQSSVFTPDRFFGVTTNPNAFAAEGLHSLTEWETRTKELLELVSNFTSSGIVFVQLPSDSLKRYETLKWYELINRWADGFKCKIGLKIPPYRIALDFISGIDPLIPINVTGLSDCDLALESATYAGITHISLIPGRMEEVGIDAKAHLAKVMRWKPNHTELIAGSMRTIEGLKWCVEYGAVPTMGKKLINQFDSFESICEFEPKPLPHQNEPTVSATNTDLRDAFFLQMNKAGEQVKTEFINSL